MDLTLDMEDYYRIKDQGENSQINSHTQNLNRQLLMQSLLAAVSRYGGFKGGGAVGLLCQPMAEKQRHF